jgi:hypothetical protein
MSLVRVRSNSVHNQSLAIGTVYKNIVVTVKSNLINSSKLHAVDEKLQHFQFPIPVNIQLLVRRM